MNRIKLIRLIAIFSIFLLTVSNAQYKLNTGNVWLYSSDTQEWKISIIDTVTLFDSLLYYETDWQNRWIPKKDQSSFNGDKTVRTFIRTRNDGLFERIKIYPDSSIEMLPSFYKENAQLRDKWIYYLTYHNDSTEVDTFWAEVEGVFPGISFGEWRIIKKIHYYSLNPQNIIDYYKYFCDDFGELTDEGYGYVNVLTGCYIDGIMYGDTCFTTVGISDIDNQSISYQLKQNYPNPFNPNTTIAFDITESGLVKIQVYDITGRLVSSLLNEYKKAGSYKVIFDGNHLSSGLYIYSMTINNFYSKKNMLLIK